MDREEMYLEGNKVLSDVEYSALIGVYESAEEKCQDIASDIREAISGIMSKLWEKRSCTEFVGKNFTVINRFGDIGIIHNDDDLSGAGEISLDDISMVDALMDILADMI